MAKKSDQDESSYPITVAIGASAGGLDATKKFIQAIKPDTGVAYIILIHHLKNDKSLLAEILRLKSKIPVVKASNRTKLQADKIYVIPPDYIVEDVNSHFHFTKMQDRPSDHAPIDNLFRVLARNYGDKCAGVILSGTGSDGTLGMKTIHLTGGLTIAQEISSAQFDGMPQSAISTGIVDKIFKPEEIAPYIARWVESRQSLLQKLSADKDITGSILNRIFHLIKSRTGRDFYRYKENTIFRRLERRMQLANIDDLEQYYHKLLKDEKEIAALSDEFLINVTRFFRDPEVFEKLQKELISNLLQEKEPSDRIRIWCVGCATGEEAYSVAILFLEEMKRQEKHPDLQIFASDLHEKSLERARSGFYPGKIEVDVSAQRLKKYFRREDGGYRVRKSLREHIVFTPHNVLSDPPFSNLDLIVCRNLLIYLKKETQKDVFELFHYSLKSQGHLLLGNSEHLDNHDLYKSVNKDIALHQKTDIKGPEPRLPVFPKLQPIQQTFDPERRDESLKDKGLLHYQLVEKIAPPSILLDSKNMVLHLSATAGKYLRISGGSLSKDIFELLRPEFSSQVKTLIYSSRGKLGNFRTRPMQFKDDGETKKLTVNARRMTLDKEDMTILLFEEYAPNETEPTEKSEIKDISKEGGTDILQKELIDKQQQLKAIREEYEANREEMKASNEELQSANEELRSTMEELETSKEELQSMNEELVTLNQENKHKVNELRQLSDDLQNLLASTEIATLFLDRDFKILRFTPKLNELFNVREADHGRKISDQTHQLGYDNFIEDGLKVLKTLNPVEREIQDRSGKTYLTRILPYRSSEDRIEGIVITFVDISELKNAEKALRISEAKYRALIDASASLIWTTDDKGEMGRGNEKFMEYTGFSFNQVKGKNWLRAIHDEDQNDFTKAIKEATRKKSSFNVEVRIYQDETKDHRWHFISMVPLGSQNKNVQFTGMGIDIHDRKESEEELKKAKEKAEEAAQAREDFLAHMSHEIRSPINSILGLTHMLLKDKPRKDQSEMLNLLKSSGSHLKKLINDILDLSQLRAGKTALILEKENLFEITEEIAAIYKFAAGQKNIELKTSIDKRIDKLYEIDRLKVTQVLNNLISNAIKFTEKGSVTFSVTLLKAKSKIEEISFRVEDTGIGIKEEHLEKIFDNFSQADTSTKRLFGGTGLGLTLCQKYLEVMGSTMNVQSAYGEGSDFEFTLNLSRVPPKKQEKNENSPTEKEFHSLNVLVVDDADINRTVMKAFLSSFDQVECQLATGGQEAIDKCKAEKFDLILMDIRMPVVDGFEATEKIRKIDGYAETPIVAVTADISKKVKDHLRDDFFNGLIPKPIEPAELKNLIQRHSEIPRDEEAPQKTDFPKLSEFLKGNTKSIEAVKTDTLKLLDEIKAEVPKALSEGDTKELSEIRHKNKWVFEIFEFDELAKCLSGPAFRQKSTSKTKREEALKTFLSLVEKAKKKVSKSLSK